MGGGFYGAALALESTRRHGHRTVLVERGASLLGRASYANQARVHHGYHYPRSVVTAARSRVNLPRFRREFADAVIGDFRSLYAIARGFSNVSAAQFERFCARVGAPLTLAPASLSRLFDAERIEAVFLVDEPAFDATVLRDRMISALDAAGVEVRTGREALRVRPGAGLEVDVADATGRESTLVADEVFLCTYARTNHVLAASGLPRIPLKHEIAEIALIEPAPELAALGITVMCGPFFSTMPFPARGLHSLSHVRYTPHAAWTEGDGTEAWEDPYAILEGYARRSRVREMVQDARRYVPALAQSRPVDSLWEVKTVLPKNDVDDGRPILYRADHGLPGLHVIMGSKIDNVYDVLEAVDAPVVEARG